ncbi:disulfide bond formation protein DsbA [Alkanindiges hydrocarboniclasticus]|jgi:protein dithiol oxidoreductase (disulfide-forming)|uniref:Thiol:disulfide interchange protein n=1 Tax=Alkanindiges hydrocarboniclasticus TaxID=1907941 RepID=A0A1S8CXV8_9GAMM|nr:thiol:disulfide interchange protein DsbA/DsbL [Alkanindiges hydrocarboniclasticus]ONG41310.1 disulfide bond formation protein DsbA [Alkanindiges hydrocarboniclasticus]
MKHLVLSAMTASVMAMSGLAMASEPFVAGKDYTVIANPGKVDKPGMIEVREFFWYGCPHCYILEPHVASWLAKKPANVNFVRSPAAMNPVWEQNARGYYAVDLMGMTNKVHKPLFDAIHQKNQRLFDQKSLANFYKGYGVDSNKFNAMFNSFAVSGKVAQSKQLAQAYQLDGVPAMVVNGKYVVKGENQKVIQVVNYLINKERALVKKPAPAKK